MADELTRRGRWNNEKRTRAWAGHLGLTVRKAPGRASYRIADPTDGSSVAVDSIDDAREWLQRTRDEKEWGARQPVAASAPALARVAASTDLGPPRRILEALEEGGKLLRQAADDFERMSVRSRADAIRAAAAVLEYGEIQIAAAELVMSAEREIAFANPAKPVGRPGKDADPGEQIVRPRGLSDSTVRELRSIHRRIDNDRWAELKKEARETERPLTRKRLRTAARAPKATPDRVVLPNYVLHRSTLAGMAEHVESNTVDLVAAAGTREYPALGRFAEHALAPHGNLLVFTDQEYLPEILRTVPTRDLVYRWTLVVKGRLRSRNGVRSSWHPVLVFERPGEDWLPTFGVIRDTATTDVQLLERYVRQGLSMRGDRELTICDPCLGEHAATALATLVVPGTRFIGGVPDAETEEAVRNRLPSQEEEKSARQSEPERPSPYQELFAGMDDD